MASISPLAPSFRASADPQHAVEHMVGPVVGTYFACYAIATPRGYYAYAKICRERPPNVWEAPAAVARLAAGPCAETSQALAEVTSRAVTYVLATLPAQHESVEVHAIDTVPLALRSAVLA